MTESEELESYNKEFSDRVSKRKPEFGVIVITYPTCHGRGYFTPTVWDMGTDRKKCHNCNGHRRIPLHDRAT